MAHSIDNTHSEIGFTVRHMMFAKVRGQFKTWNAKLAYDPKAPERSSVRVEIDAASIDTRENQRDVHLRSADFFDVEQFPKITFASKSIQATGKGRYALVGDLTIHGVTREVSLDVSSTGSGKDPWGNTRLGFSLSGAISREEFGLRWNQVLETGGVLVSDRVEIDVEVQVVQAQEAASASATA